MGKNLTNGKKFLTKTLMAVENNDCAIGNNDYCVHKYFLIPTGLRHQGSLDFSNFSGVETQIL